MIRHPIAYPLPLPPATTPVYSVTNGTVVHSSKYGLDVSGGNATVTIFSGGTITGPTGVLLSGAGAYLDTLGTIRGGAGNSLHGGAGGNGVDLSAIGTVANSGTVVAGAGGYGNGAYNGGAGGNGVFLSAGGVLTNTSVINGVCRRRQL